MLFATKYNLFQIIIPNKFCLLIFFFLRVRFFNNNEYCFSCKNIYSVFVKLFTLHLSQYPCKYTWHTKQLRPKEKSVHLAICRLFSKCQNVLNFEMFVVSCLQYFLDCGQKIINLIFSLFTPTTKHYTSVHPSAQTSKHQSMETSFEAANQSLTNWLSIFLLIVYYKELVSKKKCVEYPRRRTNWSGVTKLCSIRQRWQMQKEQKETFVKLAKILNFKRFRFSK